MTYRLPDFRLNPPADECRVCHRPARPHDMTCSDACELQRRLRDELAGDARRLADAAYVGQSGDALKALHRLRYAWRSNPDAYEVALRDAAVDLLLSEYCTDAEAAAWTIYTETPGVFTLANSLAIVHARRTANRQDIAA